jgi:ABC-2 type transport system permease protein
MRPRPPVCCGAWCRACLSWLSAVVGLLVSSAEAAAGVSFFVSFLPYPSSAFVAVATLPAWLHGVAEHQPVTVVVDALRALLLGRPAGALPAEALVGCGGIVAGCVPAAAVLFARRTQ